MHLLKIYPITLKWQNENKKWQKESKANLSKYTTASERCVRLAGWLAVLTSLQYLLCFALLWFALLRLLAFHSTCFAASKNKNQIQNQNQNSKIIFVVVVVVPLLPLLAQVSRRAMGS